MRRRRMSMASNRADSVRIGCAGWSIPSEHRHLFGPGESVLARYATVFDAVEINSSFYRPHQPKTYRRWAETVPDDFRFSVKMPKAISHEARLRGAGPALDRFMEEVSCLQRKLSVLLLQLPPSLAFDASTVATFLRMLRSRWSGGVVCEPRHASWFAPPVRALFDRHDISRAGVDPAPDPRARTPHGAVHYWRWHGSPRIYYSDYSPADLSRLSADIDAADRTAQRWAIFDNTASGHAIANAIELKTLASQA
ncbi:DUF72 domain-containing protein [Lysobacter gummosus]|uniref:DUF72 domain-containing protein n=2 Tax=Lysobacter gummosus TaxID=262324 RepID=UPI00363AA3BD